MRLFVAVDLDEAARQAVVRLVEDLRSRFAARGLGRGTRWVEPRHLHLTIRFIGEVPDERAQSIRQAVQPRLSTRAFDLRLTGLGVFPPAGAARVLWVGVAEGAVGLAALHDEIDARLVAIGEPTESRPFSAHLTLARFKDLDRGRSEALRATIQAVAADVGSCRIDAVTLYESRLGPAGPTYTPLLRTRLA